MDNRFYRLMLATLVLLVAAFVAEPYVRDLVYSAPTPRPIEARGALADFERATIAVFERDLPSVVQIAGQVAATGEDRRGGVQTGSGFVWDGAGHIVTNDHVIQGASELAVKLSNGEVSRAQVVGTAPNYDLAVLKITLRGKLPPPSPSARLPTSRSGRRPSPSATRSGSTS